MRLDTNHNHSSLLKNPKKAGARPVTSGSLSSMETGLTESETSTEGVSSRLNVAAGAVKVDRAYGLDFKRYLSGKRWMDAALMAWHVTVLVSLA